MQDAIVTLTSKLIRFASTNPFAINHAVEYCADWLRKRGIETAIYENQGLKSVVARIGKKGGAPSIIFNGHVDVVPGTPKEFLPRIEDRKIFGRGSYDMLGAVASMMVTISELANQALDCEVILKLVPDEEMGGNLGTSFLVQNGLLGDFVICGEPTNLDIGIQAKGVLQVQIEVPGVAAHGSRPWLGENAIISAFQKYKQLEALAFHKVSSEFFTRPSFNLAKIHAGNAINQVPDSCLLSLDIRYLPGQNPDEILEQIQQVVDGKASVLGQGVPVTTRPDEPYVTLLKDLAEQVTGRQVRLFGQDGTADTRFYAPHGIPVVEFGPIGANHHGPDEYVEIDSLHLFKETLMRLILNINEKDGVSR